MGYLETLRGRSLRLQQSGGQVISMGPKRPGATVSERQAGFRSLADPMIDTTSPHGKLILAVLAALAEFERSMILARTGEGRKRAQANGVRFGRKPKLSDFQVREALVRRANGESLVDIGRSFGVSHSTISRLQLKRPPSPIPSVTEASP